ncbi:RICIN domain-containing protein [Streptomyces prunicolor]|uniref:RICIN domain-containing protein n=1 Tax=Streptomyces prunicolor TaxID=67348 RepID=UPI003437BA6B
MQFSCRGTDNQLWAAVSLDGGYYKFVSRNTGKCLAQGEVSPPLPRFTELPYNPYAPPRVS